MKIRFILRHWFVGIILIMVLRIGRILILVYIKRLRLNRFRVNMNLVRAL